eukprot:TRINITY_DN60029_c0_g1_i1.p1 TRINITY_DN60029_c0_g1~~TRINITY_DN60029_c0_g1_i1.p1  ORF type:complete len:270 (+),score=112.64 TRINITY_DN60029_c0_g1_i1:94-903(+)
MTGARIPCVLVGNKTDLEHLRQVSYEEGEALAQSWGYPFVECSAKINHNVDEVFRSLLNEIDRMYEPEKGVFTADTMDDVLHCQCCRQCVDECLHFEDSPTLEYATAGILLLSVLMSIACMVAGIMIGVQSDQDGSDVLSYIVFGFALFSAMLGVIGLLGLRRGSSEMLRLFTLAQSFFAIAEAACVVALHSHVDIIDTNWSLITGCMGAIVIVQLVSVFLGCVYQRILAPQSEHDYLPTQYQYYSGDDSPFAIPRRSRRNGSTRDRVF